MGILNYKIMLDLESLLKNSGDSILEEYTYTRGILTLRLDLTDIEKIVNIYIKTDNVYANNFYSEKENSLYKNCRIEIKDLANVICLKNNIYIPPSDFGQMMNESRLKYNLAYGKKSSEVRYIFSLVGYGILLSCLLNDLKCITVENIIN